MATTHSAAEAAMAASTWVTTYGSDLLPFEALRRGQADGDRRVEVAAGDVTDRVGHGQDRQSERQ